MASSDSSSVPPSVSEAWVDFVAGWCSGAVSVVVLQPLDTVLTRWQAQAVPAAAGCSGSTRQSGSKLTLDASVRIAKSLASGAGFRSLWRGASPMIGAVPFQNALLMGGYGVGQAWLDDPHHPGRLAAIFAGGCAGGVLQSFLMSPVEFVKVSAQIQQAGAAPLSAREMAIRLSANVHTGLGATILRDGIPHGVWFVAYEAAKRRLQRPEAFGAASAAPPLLAGAFAATVAWVVGYPADLIKTRLQSGAATGGIRSTTRRIVAEHGWLGLYRGLGLKLVRAIPASMIGFGAYEYVKGEIAGGSQP
jgi:solute carrier family 25 (mitochondrial carnitine/acylcarnitine transporter), member 20/29